MKKLLAAIVAFAMILSLAAVPAMAGGEPDAVVFSMNTVTAAPGEEVTLVASIAGEYECHGLTLEANYDPAVLEFVSNANGEVLSSVGTLGGMVLPDHSIPGSFRMGIIMSSAPFTGSGELFTLTLRVADDAEAGTYPVEFNVTEFINFPTGAPSATPIPFELRNGAVVVETGEEPTEAPVEPTEAPVEPTEAPVEPTEAPVEPTEAPVEPTDEPAEPTEAPAEPTDEPAEPTDEPTTAPIPPTGAVALAGIGVAAIVAGAGAVIFRKKED